MRTVAFFLRRLPARCRASAILEILVGAVRPDRSWSVPPFICVIRNVVQSLHHVDRAEWSGRRAAAMPAMARAAWSGLAALTACRAGIDEEWMPGT
jgi:hypothetical protein